MYMYAGIVGFEKTAYDIGEEDSAELCVVTLQGRLTGDVSLSVMTQSGTARGTVCFVYSVHTYIISSRHVFQSILA